jgi:hypothetical protein
MTPADPNREQFARVYPRPPRTGSDERRNKTNGAEAGCRSYPAPENASAPADLPGGADER